MIVSTKRDNRGRKARIGGICFDEGRMMVFVGYHTFPNGETGKILINLDEARQFANRIGSEELAKRQKIIRWLVKKYGV